MLDYIRMDTNVNKLVERLFRHESGKTLSALVGIFGPGHIETAEDVVQESLLEAINTWPYRGVPDDPSAWLFKVAKNKALNIIKREKRKSYFQPEMSRHLESEWTVQPALNHIFSEEQVRDGQLRMLFTCCHPSISKDSQVALALKTLCGFSIEEIAHAFLSKYDTINRRLVRARKQIRESEIPFEIPRGEELQHRLGAVLETVYLLFNEGYNSSSGDKVIRYDLCLESIRLAQLIEDHPTITEKSSVYALLALMMLNASRFEARIDENGRAVELADQDRKLWNQTLMTKGFEYLTRSTEEDHLNKYHVLAAISASHCSAETFEDTNWDRILSLYDHLLKLDQSPMVWLNRTVAVKHVRGPEAALKELQPLKEKPSLKKHHLLYAIEASFYVEFENYDKASALFERAIALCPSDHERQALRDKLAGCSA